MDSWTAAHGNVLTPMPPPIMTAVEHSSQLRLWMETSKGPVILPRSCCPFTCRQGTAPLTPALALGSPHLQQQSQSRLHLGDAPAYVKECCQVSQGVPNQMTGSSNLHSQGKHGQ